MKRIKYAPIAVLILALAYSIIVTSNSNVVLVAKHYAGMLFVALSIIFLIRKPRIGRHLTFVTLLLGTLDVLEFTPTVTRYYIGFTFSHINPELQIQEFSLLVMLLFLIVNIPLIQSYFEKRLNRTQ
ncbi:hypothetical protein [Chitinophaga vietnamensis]|uniref:hypothetical protein n=1 Tax=Chitinophaga vietnamensis TaxID=2593957 RepID=UPI001177A5EA|nr:hypothetical protein [Chitinophaga vietnamensis]